MVDIFPTWMTLRCIFLTPDLKLPNSDDFGRDLGLHVKKMLSDSRTGRNILSKTLFEIIVFHFPSNFLGRVRSCSLTWIDQRDQSGPIPLHVQARSWVVLWIGAATTTPFSPRNSSLQSSSRSWASVQFRRWSKEHKASWGYLISYWNRGNFLQFWLVMTSKTHRMCILIRIWILWMHKASFPNFGAAASALPKQALWSRITTNKTCDVSSVIQTPLLDITPFVSRKTNKSKKSDLSMYNSPTWILWHICRRLEGIPTRSPVKGEVDWGCNQITAVQFESQRPTANPLLPSQPRERRGAAWHKIAARKR